MTDYGVDLDLNGQTPPIELARNGRVRGLLESMSPFFARANAAPPTQGAPS
ncbi:hypothetical protein QBD00_004811 [Ochrobactrum sp. AN78]|nr:hypothetical protein [Ochrobactrum sp. AN78]